MGEDNVTSNGEESFAAMFEASLAETGKDLNIGDKVEAKIISIGETAVFFDVGVKLDGMAEKEELLDENGEFPFQEGDVIELFVVKKTKDELVLSKALAGVGGLNQLQDAFEAKIPVEGKVKAVRKGGFDVEVFHRRAFCPVSQIDAIFVEDQDAYVGESFLFEIIKFENGGKNIVLSRRKLLEREREAQAQAFFEDVKEGDVVEGTVMRLMPYGAFVELIPGTEGMVHISELSWGRIAEPAEAVSVGQQVSVKVLSIGDGDKGRKKISLSIKQAQADPWETIGDTFNVGQKTTGKIVRLADFGAFVEIAPGIEGLVHVSEISYVKRVHKPEDELSAGQSVSVLIKDIDLDKKRISLSIKDAEGDPWLDVADKYKSGQTVTGTVEKMERFGLFVSLEPGITGLLPKSKIAEAVNAKELSNARPGDSVELCVESVKPEERKISLAPTESTTVEKSDWKPHAKPQRMESNGGFGGLLGEKLQAALNNKNS
ncbi:30S ribosomal protein S1 [Desulfovibrio inopinatus]|uniref:30S ribosomal protein S1 n=1 Tax=Desulfovibrio inopinatus TaxID=102109 RepID=UPI0003FD4295|nr:30S ribosomal protein S1 [Desulfovibrio inopinatus]